MNERMKLNKEREKKKMNIKTKVAGGEREKCKLK